MQECIKKKKKLIKNKSEKEKKENGSKGKQACSENTCHVKGINICWTSKWSAEIAYN